MARLKQHYDTVVRKAMTEEFGYANPLQVPRLDKVIVNMGVGEAVADTKKLTAAVAELTGDHRPEAGGDPREEVDRDLQSCARACRSAARSPCGGSGCTSSWTGW